jgi:hypothetical protein
MGKHEGNMENIGLYEGNMGKPEGDMGNMGVI